ncbi:MAG: DUF255 domain-containing protein [Bacteroidetes bacterium]|nr:DUF255 domain-containing protein [Bacteroidota bacterium]
MKRYLWFILPVFIVLSGFAGLHEEEVSEYSFSDDDNQIEWLTFEEALMRNAEEPKMIFIDFYTDWCSWCKKMDANIFSNPQIGALMNQDYYAVKFNAEEDISINWKEKEYVLDNTRRRPAHEIAIELATTDERLGYPTFVVLDNNFEKKKAYQGYKTVDALKQILEYYGDEDNYKKKNWIQFIQGNQSTTD